MNALLVPTFVPTPASRGRRLAVATLWAFGLLGLAGLAGALALLHGLDASPLQVTINDARVTGSLNFTEWSAGHQALAVGGLAVALFAVLVVVPVALLLALLAVVLAVLLSVGLPLLVIAGVAALLLSPLALLGWLLWRALRPSPTIAA